MNNELYGTGADSRETWLGQPTVPGKAGLALKTQGRKAVATTDKGINEWHGAFCAKKSTTRFRAVGVNLILLPYYCVISSIEK